MRNHAQGDGGCGRGGRARAACSSGPAQPNLGPFSIGSCKLGWADGTNGRTVYSSEGPAVQAAETANTSASNDPYNGGVATNYQATRAAGFSITLTATAVVSSFTVAYYDSSGTEISTGTAGRTGLGPDELTAGQKASFLATGAPAGASSCQVIGSDSASRSQRLRPEIQGDFPRARDGGAAAFQQRADARTQIGELVAVIVDAIIGFPRQAEHALADDVLLDLAPVGRDCHVHERM